MTPAVFLSASVPDPRRDRRYYDTADLTAIRDAVRALVTVVLPKARLVWGGHPAITPLVRLIAEDMGITGADKIRLFQSTYFSGRMPKDNAAFESVVKVRGVKDDLEASLDLMRRQMIASERFAAGVFIGGMEGVETEYKMFLEKHPHAKALPIASTGGAALLIFRRRRSLPTELKDDLAYPSLFRRLLGFQMHRRRPKTGGTQSGT
jgi:SLOG cluster3 family